MQTRQLNIVGQLASVEAQQTRRTPGHSSSVTRCAGWSRNAVPTNGETCWGMSVTSVSIAVDATPNSASRCATLTAVGRLHSQRYSDENGVSSSPSSGWRQSTHTPHARSNAYGQCSAGCAGSRTSKHEVHTTAISGCSLNSPYSPLLCPHVCVCLSRVCHCVVIQERYTSVAPGSSALIGSPEVGYEPKNDH